MHWLEHRHLPPNGEWDRDDNATWAGDWARPKSTTLWPILLTALVDSEFECESPSS